MWKEGTGMEQMNESQRKLAEDNMGLVGKMIVQMKLHYDLDELHSVGYLGLCKAAESYREGGPRFSTYACHIIRNELINYINKCSRSREKVYLGLEAGLYQPVSERDDIRKVEERLTAQQALRQMEYILDEDEVAIVRLLYLGKSTAETGAACGLSASAVRKARQRIAGKYRRWMEGGAGDL